MLGRPQELHLLLQTLTSSIGEYKLQHHWRCTSLPPENKLLSRDRALKWPNAVLARSAQIQPQNLIGWFLKEAELYTPFFCHHFAPKIMW